MILAFFCGFSGNAMGQCTLVGSSFGQTPEFSGNGAVAGSINMQSGGAGATSTAIGYGSADNSTISGPSSLALIGEITAFSGSGTLPSGGEYFRVYSSSGTLQATYFFGLVQESSGYNLQLLKSVPGVAGHWSVTSVYNQAFTGGFPYYFQLALSSGAIVGQTSSNGSSWTQITSTNAPAFSYTYQVGFYTYSGSSSSGAVANLKVQNASLNGAALGLSYQDVGTVAPNYGMAITGFQAGTLSIALANVFGTGTLTGSGCAQIQYFAVGMDVEIDTATNGLVAGGNITTPVGACDNDGLFVCTYSGLSNPANYPHSGYTANLQHATNYVFKITHSITAVPQGGSSTSQTLVQQVIPFNVP